MTAFRPGGEEDLAAVDAIQSAAPEAAHWTPSDYLDQMFWVAIADGVVAGFLVMRKVAPDEVEVLNLAVAPAFRRQGIARGLLRTALEGFRGSAFLEVRASNRGAQKFYEVVGFRAFSTREKYYNNPQESAIVMKFHSC